MESTKLFTSEQVRKFFNKLSNQKREIQEIYKGYDKLNPHIIPCGREVFVNRTLNKWFKDKYFILYQVSEKSGLQYKKYISINNISFALNYSDDIVINMYDYSKPMDFYETVVMKYNDVLDLEGEWCEESNLHVELLKLTCLNIPEKEYVYKRLDTTKWRESKKRNKKVEDFMTTASFICKTEHEANIKLKESDFAHEIYGLLEIKEIK